MNFVDTSQAGQATFAKTILEVSPGWIAGSFVDIGCNHPTERSNTCALEQLGWRGLLVDSDDYCVKLCREQRASLTIHGDGTTLDWAAALQEAGLPPTINFLSLDCDGATLPTMLRIMNAGIRWSAGCVEHDRYSRGDENFGLIRETLKLAGYDILCAEVCDQGCSFEFWVVDPMAVNMAVANRFRATGPTDWREVLRRGGIET